MRSRAFSTALREDEGLTSQCRLRSDARVDRVRRARGARSLGRGGVAGRERAPSAAVGGGQPNQHTRHAASGARPDKASRQDSLMRLVARRRARAFKCVQVNSLFAFSAGRKTARQSRRARRGAQPRAHRHGHVRYARVDPSPFSCDGVSCVSGVRDPRSNWRAISRAQPRNTRTV